MRGAGLLAARAEGEDRREAMWARPEEVQSRLRA